MDFGFYFGWPGSDNPFQKCVTNWLLTSGLAFLFVPQRKLTVSLFTSTQTLEESWVSLLQPGLTGSKHTKLALFYGCGVPWMRHRKCAKIETSWCWIWCHLFFYLPNISLGSLDTQGRFSMTLCSTKYSSVLPYSVKSGICQFLGCSWHIDHHFQVEDLAHFSRVMKWRRTAELHVCLVNFLTSCSWTSL